jgi:hypothetical protein
MEDIALQVVLALLSGVAASFLGSYLTYRFAIRKRLQLQRTKVYEEAVEILLGAFRLESQDREGIQEYQKDLNKAYSLLLLYSDDSLLELWHETIGSGKVAKAEDIQKVIVGLRKQLFPESKIGADMITSLRVTPP